VVYINRSTRIIPLRGVRGVRSVEGGGRGAHGGRER